MMHGSSQAAILDFFFPSYRGSHPFCSNPSLSLGQVNLPQSFCTDSVQHCPTLNMQHLLPGKALAP